jgi:hypothetical protein
MACVSAEVVNNPSCIRAETTRIIGKKEEEWTHVIVLVLQECKENI